MAYTPSNMPQENASNLAGLPQVNTARSFIYKVLSKGLLYPNKDTISFFQDNLEEPLRAACANLPYGEELIPAIEKLIQEFAKLNSEQIQDLQTEYVRLFDYKPACYITEGAFREHQSLGEATVDVNCFYRNAGLQVEVMEFPDHLGIELEFMHYLSYLAATKDNDTDFLEHVSTQLSFLEQHLNTWGPAVCLCVQQKTSSSFYNALANVCREYIDLDYQLLNEIANLYRN